MDEQARAYWRANHKRHIPIYWFPLPASGMDLLRTLAGPHPRPGWLKAPS